MILISRGRVFKKVDYMVTSALAALSASPRHIIRRLGLLNWPPEPMKRLIVFLVIVEWVSLRREEVKRISSHHLVA